MQSCISHIRENLKRITICFDTIDEADVWKDLNHNTNSLGNLILHLNGNIRQYVLSGLGHVMDERERESEFIAKPDLNKKTLIEKHKSLVGKACNIIESLPELSYTQNYTIQGFEMTGVEVLIHVTEHYSYHTGQIAHIVKSRKDIDLGFYKDFDLNIRNSN